MKLGVLTNVIGETPLKEALAYFKSLAPRWWRSAAAGILARTTATPACCSTTRRSSTSL